MSPIEAEAVGLEPTSRSARPPVFKTASSSGRMTSVASCGSWNRTNIKTFRASRPTVRRSRNMLSVSSGGRNRTYGLLIQSQASLPTATTPEWLFAFQECPAGVEPASPAWKAGTSAARPRAQQSGRSGSRTLKAHRSTVFETAAIAHWLALPLRAAEAGIEPASVRV